METKLKENILLYDEKADAITKAKGILATINIISKTERVVRFEFVNNVFKFYTEEKVYKCRDRKENEPPDKEK